MFSDDEQKVLSHFFTNTTENVFALINLPEVVKGALFARYSRSDKDLRSLFLSDFLNDIEFKNIVGNVNNIDDQLSAIKKAEDFYDRILVQFGHDSVAELSGAHVALENISNLAAKFVEDTRIGISPLEKSSRYVYFNKKVNGKYAYYRDSEIMASKYADDYVNAMDFLFDTYSELLWIVRDYFAKKLPNNENLSDRAFEAVLRAKTCDTIRGLLPASTLTNVGLFGNGRAFEYLLIKMQASNLDEIKNLGDKIYIELNKVFPSFVKRSRSEFGKATVDYLKTIKYPQSDSITKDKKRVTLLHYDKDAEIRVLSKICYLKSGLSLADAIKIVKQMSVGERKKLLAEYCGVRTNRRHKPFRAFENTDYTFELVGNFGAYRDLQRHRILTQERQLLTTHFGYDIPKDLILAGCDKEYKKALDNANKLYLDLAKISKEKAQYCVPFAYNLRWYVKFNLREAYHLFELRTTRQGHPDYRKLCQEMYRQILKVHPNLLEPMKFIDLRDYDFERLESEKQIDKRLQEIKK
ncbi:MAG: FAD-dependent thymidylate synthase [Candidatus Micrarchaeia archaeon]